MPTLDLLNGIDFAFLSLDASEAKAALVERLHARGVGFIDIGMGLEFGGNPPAKPGDRKVEFSRRDG